MLQWIKLFDKAMLELAQKIVNQKRVEIISKTEDLVKANVHGQNKQEVAIFLQAGKPVKMRCNCPKAKSGRKCEHVVAVLYVIYEDELRIAKEKKKQAEESELMRLRQAEIEKIEEEQKAQEMEQRKAEELERKKKAEEIAKRLIQEENERRKQRKIQEAIMKKENTNYTYYDIEKLVSKLKIADKDIVRGQEIYEKGLVKLQQSDTGYLENRQDLVMMVNAECKTGNKKAIYTQMMISREKVMNTRCNCDDCRGKGYYYRSGECNCKYIAATMFAAEKEIEEKSLGDATDKTGAVLLNMFRVQRGKRVLASMEKNQETVKLAPRIVQYGDTLELSFRIGYSKMLIVKDLDELVYAIKNSQTMIYGKDMEINHQIDNFTKESRRWIDFIERVVEEERIIDRRIHEHRYFYGENEFKCSEVKLYGWRLDRVFELIGNEGCEYENRSSNAKKKIILHTMEKNPHICMSIDVNKHKAFDGIHVKCAIPAFFEGEKSAYYIQDEYLKKTDEEFTEKTKLLFANASNGKLSFDIGRKKLQDFYYTMLPQLADVVEIEEYHRDEIDKYLPPEVKFVFYLDNHKGNIECRACALYGEKEVTITRNIINEHMKSYEPYRMPSREDEILMQLQSIFPYYDESADVIHCNHDENLIFHVLESGVDILAGLGEVRCTQAFKNTSVVQKLKVAVGVSVQNGTLDLEIVTEELSHEELLDILAGYRKKKTYFRLKNGNFVNLENDELKMLAEMVETLHLQPKEFIKGKVHLPMYRALYLDKLLEQNSVVYSTRDKDFRNMIKNFKAVNESDFEEPESLTHIMRGYQRNGFKWMKLLESYGFGGILADDMGLGKTLQAISVLLSAKQDKESQSGTSLIVAPASLVFNWKDELERYAPELCVGMINGTQEERQELIKNCEMYDVMITSYDLLKRDISYYEDKEFHYQIIDEAQYIKNHTTAAAKSVKVIKSKVKYALTGTPIENRLSELWSIFDYLMPGFLYKYDTFKKEIETQIVKNNDEKSAKRLQKMVAPFIMRRLKQDVLKDLPDKLEETRVVALEGEQRKLYDAQVVQMRQKIATQSGEEFNRNKMQILAELTKLRQICCDPRLCFENYFGESAKTEACIELIQSAIDGSHKILLFSQFTAQLELLEKRLKKENITYYKITGETLKEKRLQLVKEFNENDVQVFLISLKAGGVGLNLTGADVVIHYDPWWNVAAQNQATDRAHRIGQQNKVTVYKLIVKQSVEEKILKMQEMKKDLADKVISGEANQLGGLSKEELLEILSV